jgi:membrane fusion protein, multidrug efflux system
MSGYSRFFSTTYGIIFAVCSIFSLVSCSEESTHFKAKSIEQIYAKEGRPVQVRTVKPETFSAYLKYPADFRARTQSTAYAKLSDVVRNVYVKVGDHVKRDQIVMGFSLDNSAYQQAKLSFENAEAAYNRTTALYAAAGVSRQDFDNTRTQYELAKENFKSVGEMIQIKAPIDGFITQLNVRISSNVNPGDPLFTVSNQDGFEAYFYVGADEIDNIRTGERAVIEGKNETIEGRVTEVSLIMDPVRKAFPVKAFFAGKPKTLVSGMSVDISVEAYRNDQSVIVNQKELVREGDIWVAYIVKDGKAVRKELVTGHEQGLKYEIAGGLTAGDVLVTEGAQNLSDREKVKITETQPEKQGE